MVGMGGHERLADMNGSTVDRQQKSFESVPSSARAARQFVADSLRRQGASASVVADFVLVVSELATNIIEHGNGSGLVVYFDVTDPQWWDVTVAGTTSSAPGQLLEPGTWTVAGADDTSGRGLGIVRHLMEDIVSERSDGLVSIRCRHRRDTDSE